jgi:hypothetical protein
VAESPLLEHLAQPKPIERDAKTKQTKVSNSVTLAESIY